MEGVHLVLASLADQVVAQVRVLVPVQVQVVQEVQGVVQGDLVPQIVGREALGVVQVDLGMALAALVVLAKVVDRVQVGLDRAMELHQEEVGTDMATDMDIVLVDRERANNNMGMDRVVALVLGTAVDITQGGVALVVQLGIRVIQEVQRVVQVALDPQAVGREALGVVQVDLAHGVQVDLAHGVQVGQGV